MGTVLGFKHTEGKIELVTIPFDCGLSSIDIEIIRRSYMPQLTAEIALEMRLSVEQVKYHIRRMLRKLRLGNRVAVVALVARDQWFPEMRYDSMEVQTYIPTEKQRLLLAGVCAGLSTAQIAVANHISEETVNSNLDTIFERTGIHQRILLARVAIEQGWVK
ncbi:MAG: LuxR C-terminal-related transcriptional regulator [Patescibacteria group bacterium]